MLLLGFIAGRDGMPVTITLDVYNGVEGRLLACGDDDRRSGSIVDVHDVYETQNACVVATLRELATDASSAIGTLSFLVVGGAAHELFVTKCSAIVRLMRLALNAGYITMDDVAAAIRPTARGADVLAHVGLPTEIGLDLS